MAEYEAWGGSKLPQCAAIARGEDLFNRRTFQIAGVSGLNDELDQAVITGTCTACHDTPHAGDHSYPAPLRIGIDNPSPVGRLDASGLPVYTLRNKNGSAATLADVVRFYDARFHIGFTDAEEADLVAFLGAL